MREINVGIIGFGNIGSAVAALLRQNRQLILKRSGIEIKLRKVCDLRKVKAPCPLTADPGQIINDPKIDIVVEAIGGVNPALKYILAALKQGKHVVTPNKEVIAKHMGEIFSAARQAKSQIWFEGAVGGGIPIIQLLLENLAANQIQEVYGIVNGTTNYILSKMSEHESEFSEALKDAQQKGYAEPDPASDIKGYDASYKAVILAAVAFGAKVEWKNVYFEGIEKITQEDLQYARETGYAVKLLAIARHSASGLDVRVHPALISRSHPLAAVSDNYNAIYVKGKPVGDLMFYGQGAGGGPTASAIISDIIRIAKNPEQKLPDLAPVKAQKIDEVSSRYYVRLQAPDRYGVLAGISRAFAEKKVSIAAVVQKETVGNLATIVILLENVAEKNLKAALKVIGKLPVVHKLCNVIRIIS